MRVRSRLNSLLLIYFGNFVLYFEQGQGKDQLTRGCSMLHSDLKMYLMVSRIERCPHEEYDFRYKILRDFVSITGNIPFSQLQKKHLIDFIRKENEEAAARGLQKDYLLRAKFTLERFILWLRCQPAHPAHEPSGRN